MSAKRPKGLRVLMLDSILLPEYVSAPWKSATPQERAAIRRVCDGMGEINRDRIDLVTRGYLDAARGVPPVRPLARCHRYYVRGYVAGLEDRRLGETVKGPT